MFCKYLHILLYKYQILVFNGSRTLFFKLTAGLVGFKLLLLMQIMVSLFLWGESSLK